MELTAEQFQEVPEFLRENFEEKDGKYFSIESLKLAAVKNTANNLDSELKSIRGEFSQLKETFTAEQQRKADEIKAARDEALEEATSKGEAAKIKELYEQKMADLELRSYERGKSEAAQEFKVEQLDSQAKSMRSSLAAKLARDEDSQAAIEMLLNNMIKPSENEIGLFDSSGSAVSIKDLKQFEDEVIKKSPLFKHLIKPDHVVNGGGLASGGNQSFSSTPTNTAAEAAKKKGDLNGYLTAALKFN